MGGTNPYMEQVEHPLPKNPYKLTVLAGGEKHEIQVDPSKLPYSSEGFAGSILEIALGHDIEIDHACGGVCACSTCHVHVTAGLTTCPEASEEEEDQIDYAADIRGNSRLACQCVPDGTQDVVVEVPNWNRNHVSEDH